MVTLKLLSALKSEIGSDISDDDKGYDG